MCIDEGTWKKTGHVVEELYRSSEESQDGRPPSQTVLSAGRFAMALVPAT